MCAASHENCIVRPTVARSVKVKTTDSAQHKRHLDIFFQLFPSHPFPGSVPVRELSIPATFKLPTAIWNFPQFPRICPPPVVVACRVSSYVLFSLLAALDAACHPATTRDSVYVCLAICVVYVADIFLI